MANIFISVIHSTMLYSTDLRRGVDRKKKEKKKMFLSHVRSDDGLEAGDNLLTPGGTYIVYEDSIRIRITTTSVATLDRIWSLG